MDAEMLTQVMKVIVASVLALALGYVVTKLVLRAFESLMDAVPPGAWLAICVIILVGAASIVGFLFGTALP